MYVADYIVNVTRPKCRDTGKLVRSEKLRRKGSRLAGAKGCSREREGRQTKEIEEAYCGSVIKYVGFNNFYGGA